MKIYNFQKCKLDFKKTNLSLICVLYKQLIYGFNWKVLYFENYKESKNKIMCNLFSY
jgi:hypothetical protein